MPAPSSSIDIGTLGAVYYHPEALAKIKGIMLYVGQEIVAEELPAGATPEEQQDLAMRNALIQHFTRAPEHWNNVVRMRFAVDPAIVSVRALLVVPFANLDTSQREAVNDALYQAMWRLVDEYKEKVSIS